MSTLRIKVVLRSKRVVFQPNCGDHLRPPGTVFPMVSGRQIRAGRALLNWSQQELADKAVVSANAVARLERGQADSRTSTVTAIEKALAKGGIEFIAAGNGRGEGVRLLRDR